MSKYIVYKIYINGSLRYVGYTNNLTRRKSQHLKSITTDTKKYLYKKIRELENPSLEFTIDREFGNSGDAKRWEAYLILDNYFKTKDLWQSFPISFKYF